jgi:hypothetical protein
MQNETKSIPVLLRNWIAIKDELETLYKNRDLQNTSGLMEQGINLYKHFLFMSNERPIEDPIPYHHLICKPVNLEERLTFIQSRPSLYQSYRQLCELILEQEKIYVKQQIKRKASSHLS